ncbi:MAG: hypothetical protein AB1665_01340 [Candidatus Thermoplasmatota archaeon]
MTEVELDSEVRDALRSEIALVFSQAPGILRLRAYLFERCEERSVEDAVALVSREIGAERNDAAVLAEHSLSVCLGTIKIWVSLGTNPPLHSGHSLLCGLTPMPRDFGMPGLSPGHRWTFHPAP